MALRGSTFLRGGVEGDRNFARVMLNLLVGSFVLQVLCYDNMCVLRFPLPCKLRGSSFYHLYAKFGHKQTKFEPLYA